MARAIAQFPEVPDDTPYGEDDYSEAFPPTKPGFTIVELLVVIVVIGILAMISIVSYNGVVAKAKEVALKADLSSAMTQLWNAKIHDGVFPANAGDAGVKTGGDSNLKYRVVPNKRGYCLTGSRGDLSYFVTSQSSTPVKGSCENWILVPGDTRFGTNDFWIMKYEAKNVGGVATTQPSGTPWVSIGQTTAISTASAACDGCHLTTEAEWMTLAANILDVPSNWIDGTVGSSNGMYVGHSDGSPAALLASSANDSDGYSGTGNSAGESTVTGGVTGNTQRRTFTLSNGEVIWDFVGNAWEWTTGTIAGGAQPGAPGQTAYTSIWQKANTCSASILWNGFPESSRPGAISAQAEAWAPACEGGGGIRRTIGVITSNPAETTVRGFIRGGSYGGAADAFGVLALNLILSPANTNAQLTFRVAM